MRHYDWPPEKTEDALRETIVRVGETAAIYSVDVGQGYSAERISDDAKQILEGIALQSQLQTITQKQNIRGRFAAFSKQRSLEEELRAIP